MTQRFLVDEHECLAATVEYAGKIGGSLTEKQRLGAVCCCKDEVSCSDLNLIFALVLHNIIKLKFA